MNKRPISISLLAWLYILVGTVGLVFHFPEVWRAHEQRWGVVTEATELAAIVAGVFLLRGRNWARWLAVAWIGFHVVLSAFNAFQGFTMHCVLFVLIAWIVFHRAASTYFGMRERSI